jgi:hypothetical protein
VTYLLVALLALALGWCWGHTTARTVHIPIGAHPDDDEAAWLADERLRFDQLTAGLDPDQDDDTPRSSAA